MDKRTANKAKLQCFTSMFLFGTIGLFVRGIALPSAVIALVRGIIGAAFLAAVMAVRRKAVDFSAVRRNLPLLAASGAAIGINWILLFEAYRYTTVAAATVCYYLAPVFVILASPLLLGERITRKKGICAAVSLAGVVLVSGIFSGNAEASSSHGIGILCGTAAAVFYASVILLNKKITGLTALERTVFQLGLSAAVLLPYVLRTGGIGDIAALSAKGLLLLLIVSIVHTGVTYVMYFGSIGRLPVQTAALLSYIDPVVAVLLSALVLHEPLTLTGILGAALVLGSTMISEGVFGGEE
ncbi:MAG: EamA family transporter [Clostridia bacterium]|nr:EamA family transporter [Clostridia bacterium]